VNRVFKNLTFYILILLILFTAFGRLVKPTQIKEYSYSKFLDLVESENVKEILLLDKQVNGKLKDDSQFSAFVPADDKELLPLLRKSKVNINVNPPTTLPWYLEILLNWLPII